MNKSISLVIPCYNEEGNINQLVSNCKKFFELEYSELILVNNGSTDKTKDAIEILSKKNKKIKLVNVEKNIGFGHGLKEGLKAAKYEYLAYTHADLQTDPDDVVRALKVITNENEFVKGERVNKLKNEWSIFDIFISFSMTVFTSLLLKTFMTDIHAQPNVFHKLFFKKLMNLPNDFMFDVWIYYKAKKNKLKISRIPVIFNKNSRFYGEGNNDTLLKTIKGSWLHIIGTLQLVLRKD